MKVYVNEDGSAHVVFHRHVGGKTSITGYYFLSGTDLAKRIIERYKP